MRILTIPILAIHLVSKPMNEPAQIKIILPEEIVKNILVTHIVYTVKSPEDNTSVCDHIKNMRTLSKKYHAIVQQPHTMHYFFTQLSTLNKDVNKIREYSTNETRRMAITKAAQPKVENVPFINLFLIYNHYSETLLPLLHCTSSAFEILLQNNTLPNSEALFCFREAQRSKKIDHMRLLIRHAIPLEKISFIEEIQEERRTNSSIEEIIALIQKFFKKHILFTQKSAIYDCIIPIMNCPLFYLSIGSKNKTQKLFDYGINPHSLDHNKSPLQCNIIQGKNNCVAIFLKYIAPTDKDLLCAVISENIYALEAMLKKENNITERQFAGILIKAIHLFYVDPIELLLQHISDQDIKLNCLNAAKKLFSEYQRYGNSKLYKKRRSCLAKILTILCKNLNISLKI
jgi:hypothetical protein